MEQRKRLAYLSKKIKRRKALSDDEVATLKILATHFAVPWNLVMQRLKTGVIRVPRATSRGKGLSKANAAPLGIGYRLSEEEHDLLAFKPLPQTAVAQKPSKPSRSLSTLHSAFETKRRRH